MYPTTDGWHKLKVEVRNTSATQTSFWCYFDGKLLKGSPIIDTTLARVTQGQFGLYSFQQSATGLASYFDNITVKNLTATSVEEEHGSSSSIPTEFTLEQNYPNPFNPSTKITFELPKAGSVDLRVYDMLGREVAVLATGTRMAGAHTVTFDGAGLSSGLYFYRLTTGSFAETKKMMMVK
jgi:hypothetical protein